MLFVVDYDGTLARENNPPEKSVLTRISILKSQSMFKFVLATARPLNDIENFTSLDIFDALILELGGVLFLPPMDLIVFKSRRWNDIISMLSARIPAVNRGELLYYFDEESLPQALDTLAEIAHYDPIEIKKVGSRTHVFAPKNLDKEVGLRRLLRLTGWEDHQIVAIGDSPSDLPLFRAASVKVAVANANDKLKDKADLITNKSYGEGVVEAIEKILGEEKRL